MSDVVTGEGVALEVRLARFPSRAIGILIDLFLLAVIAIGVIAAVDAGIGGFDPAAQAALALATVVTIVVGVPTVIETLTRGRSLGKLVMGLRVVRDDGGPVRFRHALTRALAGVFADFYLTIGVGAIVCSLLNERGKRIGDLLAGTVVVRERVPATGAAIPPPPGYLHQWSRSLELARLPDGLAMAARDYLSRVHHLSPQVRDQLGVQLANQVSHVVAPPPPPNTPPWAYLSAVLTERTRRARQHAPTPAEPQTPGELTRPQRSRPDGAAPEPPAGAPSEANRGQRPADPGGFAPPT